MGPVIVAVAIASTGSKVGEIMWTGICDRPDLQGLVLLRMYVTSKLYNNSNCDIGCMYMNLLPTINDYFNSLWPRHICRHFPDDIFKYIFLNENEWIAINVSVKCFPKSVISNILALIEIIVWRHPGDKPSSQPVMVSLLTHICVTRPRWVKWGYESRLYFKFGTKLYCSKYVREQWWFFYAVYIGSHMFWSSCVKHSTESLLNPKFSKKSD